MGNGSVDYPYFTDKESEAPGEKMIHSKPHWDSYKESWSWNQVPDPSLVCAHCSTVCGFCCVLQLFGGSIGEHLRVTFSFK